MEGRKRYILNRETLRYEIREVSQYRFVKALATLLAAALIFALYVWLYLYVFRLDTPRIAVLKRQNARWISRIEMMSSRLDNDEAELEALIARDGKVYRQVFGMDSVSVERRYAGVAPLPGDILSMPLYDPIRRTAARLDMLTCAAAFQDSSYAEISDMQKRAGELATHIPAFPPLNTDKSTYKLSSPFGYRSDPINGSAKQHTGMDFACKPGNIVRATGDGVVEKAEFETGYGNSIVIYHGFGYRTRYAHLSRIDVEPGQVLTRGNKIGATGASGRVTGPHLHYEVLYGRDFVNPADYMDLDMSPKEYMSLVGGKKK